MKRFMVFLMCLCIITACGDSPAFADENIINGLLWRRFDDIGAYFNDSTFPPFMKHMFIELIYQTGSYVDPIETKKKFSTEVKVKELAATLDEFYKDDENVSIPIVVALHSAVLTGRGEKYKAEQLLIRARNK